ncbi:acetylserotonin O-methyltransferase 1 [Brachypodium distachyon]|uniref:acetylserotonin O-methyltransferase n=1 Tax=Brachypodium distachyon TaxID=15368 RepID=I1I2T5_BRADI|nr:acetylserotonin O-methyltransferase 1 [Brachypodium distachyon]KQJ96042.1 hypothetical protein BRADI_3g20597v3 [Brachypodium distachyon]|eukprot:XP_003571634.3 acetylserotonin O-methyltransferase 1 [Brachypodium distachyon]
MAHVCDKDKDEPAMSKDDLLQAQTELYHPSLGFIKSMALRAAADLRIPDAIHRLGGAATLSELADATGIHTTKVSHLRRLMRVLTTSGIFSVVGDSRTHAPVYKLTRVSRLLVEDGGTGLSPMVLGVYVNPAAVNALFSMREWFTAERSEHAGLSLFELAHGCGRWEMAADQEDAGVSHDGMVADSRVVMEALLKDSGGGGGVFQGVSSLMDVGGGHGAVAAAVARAFPRVKCTVLELPQVVAGAPAVEGDVRFVAEDMFQHISSADAVLLKWILHCWQDEDCVKILKKCKEAIPTRDAGGKVTIIDMVVGLAVAGSPETVSNETQVFSDVYKMYMDGVEREEHEWKKIFLEAGFSDYKISPVLGFRSIIEVYP